MGKALDITLDQEVYDGLVQYLEQEFGSTRAKSLIVNMAVREFLKQKGILVNPRRQPEVKPDQGNLFKE